MALAKRSQEDGRAESVSFIERLCAPCTCYASVLLDYVINFGGGEDSFIIQFVDKVSKQFNADVILGEQFWQALTYTDFYDKTCKYPLVRAALLLCNLSSNKVEDGIARLLSKSDIRSAAAKSLAVASARAERVLQEAIDIVESISTMEKCLKPLGQFFVRVGLKLIGAEKKGREGITYSMKQIRSAFVAKISELVGGPVRFDKWAAVEDDSEDDGNNEPKPKASKTAAPEAAVQLASLGDHSSSEWLCSQAGFTMGLQVKEKACATDTSPEHLHVIFEIMEDKISLHQVCSFHGAPRKVSVTVAELLKNWAVTRIEPPVAMASAPSAPSIFDEQLRRNDIFKIIVDLHNKHAKNYSQLQYYRRPDHVRTKSLVKAEALVLVPLVPAANIMTGSKPGSIVIGDCCLMPAAKPSIQDSPDVWAKNSIVNGFWWVAKTSDRKLVNVEETTAIVKDFVIPTLTNSVDLQPHTKLYVYTKPKSAAVPLLNAMVMDGDSDDAPEARTRAKGKAKGKAKPAAKGKASAAKGKAKSKSKA
jgi:hypothetical protein